VPVNVSVPAACFSTVPAPPIAPAYVKLSTRLNASVPLLFTTLLTMDPGSPGFPWPIIRTPEVMVVGPV
jgi:hypothetical protein